MSFVKRLLGVLIYLLLIPQAVAGAWYIDPVSSVRFGYEDNVRLLTSRDDEGFSSLLSVKAPFGFQTEVSDVYLTPQLESIKYDGLSELDSDDQRLGLDAKFRSGRSLFSLNVGYERDSTRTSELETTGFVQASKRRISKTFMPYWNYVLTERWSLQFNYQYSDVSYQDIYFTRLVDYRYDKTTAGLVYKFSDKIDFYSNLSTSKYAASAVDTVVRNYAFQGGANYRLSEQLSVSVFADFARTESMYFGAQDVFTDNVVLLDVGFKQAYETMLVWGSVRTSETPSSLGRMLRTNVLKLAVRDNLSARIFLSLQGQVYKNTNTGGFGADTNDRLYYFVESSLNWGVTRWWSVGAVYRYRRQNYTNVSNGVADSNAVFFTARYAWPKEPFPFDF